MEDDLFDNGIDGTEFESSADFYYDDMEEHGGIYLYDEGGTQIVYFYGQWNDSGVDPDRILVRCDVDEYNSYNYHVYIDSDKIWVRTPGKNFDLPLRLQLSDFVDVEPYVLIAPMKTSISEIQDLLSEKKLKFNFDKDKFKAKLERYKNLLAFT